jgi:hypothetical protein
MDRWLEHYAATCFQRGADTAHDLKTPLNIAVLNLELLRMRVRALCGEDDEKVERYSQAVEFEVRRLARIIDSYFVYCLPPKEQTLPGPIDANAVCATAAARSTAEIRFEGSPAYVVAHPARLADLFRFTLEGAAKLADSGVVTGATTRANSGWHLHLSAKPAHVDVELERLFKYYYTDASGNPDLSFATARLIAGTLGGTITARVTNGGISVDVALPLGDS